MPSNMKMTPEQLEKFYQQHDRMVEKDKAGQRKAAKKAHKRWVRDISSLETLFANPAFKEFGFPKMTRELARSGKQISAAEALESAHANLWRIISTVGGAQSLLEPFRSSASNEECHHGFRGWEIAEVMIAVLDHINDLGSEPFEHTGHLLAILKGDYLPPRPAAANPDNSLISTDSLDPRPEKES